jgi:hypothetical protein
VVSSIKRIPTGSAGSAEGDANMSPADPSQLFTPGPAPKPPFVPQRGVDFTPWDPNDPKQNMSVPIPDPLDPASHNDGPTIGPDPGTGLPDPPWAPLGDPPEGEDPHLPDEDNTPVLPIPVGLPPIASAGDDELRRAQEMEAPFEAENNKA